MTKKQPVASIIIPAKNEGHRLKDTIESLYSVRTGLPFETIVVNDATQDNCCDFLRENSDVTTITTSGLGSAGARNVGASQASGDIYVFCDAHLLFEDDWLDRLLEPVQTRFADAVSPAIVAIGQPDALGYGIGLDDELELKWGNRKEDGPFISPVLPGGCLAISRDPFNKIGGFEKGFKVWGHEDVEISINLWLSGYTCMVVPDVTVQHYFRSAHPYPVTFEHVDYNLLWMAYKHFSHERISKVRKKLTWHDPATLERQVQHDFAELNRQNSFVVKRYDDNWFFNKFGINF